MTKRPTWAELQEALGRAAADERHVGYYLDDDPETGNLIIARRCAERSAAEARRLMKLATMTEELEKHL